MVRVLAEDEGIMQVATAGLRNKDGTIETVPLYRVIKISDASPKSRLTAEEESVCDDFAALMAQELKCKGGENEKNR